ncbi:hypothetical protein [Xanthobacter versatilis]|uniref:hypothetical protein n=1 Tax=Xanthobacter autotrophicus (strain ATCC BAA-1158 / Py2) TaxID=78245 RepID=UPI00372C6823
MKSTLNIGSATTLFAPAEEFEAVAAGFRHKSGYSVGILAYRVRGTSSPYDIHLVRSAMPNSTHVRGYAGAVAEAAERTSLTGKLHLRLNLELIVDHLKLGLAARSSEPPPLKDGSEAATHELLRRFFRAVHEKGLAVEVEHFKEQCPEDALVMRQIRAAKNREFSELDKLGQ